MVGGSTSFTGSGLRDWIVQRVTAYFLAIYLIGLAVFFLTHTPLTYDAWHHLFHGVVMKVSTVLALFAIAAHAWMGVWTVITDYLPRTSIRMVAQLGVALWLLASLVWGLLIVWGV